jgi:hypothetical protein
VTGWPGPNYRLAKPLLIREASASFGHTQHLALQCTSLGGESVATGGDFKEGFWSISWYFLVKWCTTIPSEGVEEDLLFDIWSIYIEEFFLGFLPHEGFPG